MLFHFLIEFSFLIRYYSLLYQSLIPNCKLTINTLRQYISISDNIEQYIVGAASHRTSCQRIINFLLTRLYSEMDYMQFCYQLNIISVMTDFPYRLIAGTLLLVYEIIIIFYCMYNLYNLRIVTLYVNNIRNYVYLYILMSLSVTLTEFRSNGNWVCNIPVHPGLSLLKSQPGNCHISKYNLHTTSKLCALCPYSICS